MYRNVPRYVPLMVLVTGIYLTLEIPFSSRLIDVLASNPTVAEIDAIENFGRYLTGVAVAIFLAGAVVFPLLSRWHLGLKISVPVALAVGYIATSLTHTLLEDIASHTGRGLSGEEYREAFLEVVAANKVSANGYGDLQPSHGHEWKAFTVLAASLSDKDRLTRLSGTDWRSMTASEAKRQLGDFDDFRVHFYETQFEDALHHFRSYERASKAYTEKVAELPRKAEAAWQEWYRYMRGKYPNGLKRGILHDLEKRKVLFGMKLPVDKEWYIWDGDSFKRAFIAKARKEINERYNTVARLGGTVPPPGLDVHGFLALPEVQKTIRKQLGITKVSHPIVPKMTREQFKEAVWDPLLPQLSATLHNAALADRSAFRIGQDYYKQGFAAVRQKSLPAMAILLSIAGAALHIFKITGYLMRWYGIESFWKRTAIAATVTIGAFYAMASIGDSVTESDAYQQMVGDGIYPRILTAAIAIQPGFKKSSDLLEYVGSFKVMAADLPRGESSGPVSLVARADYSLPATAPVPEQRPVLTTNIPIPTPRPQITIH